jgi:aspartyl-tRNA(Asn)/glutamyl-tRNA(Gln) amidotransferase subunit A
MPAAFCGVVGITPTYGRVSRHGLISYADSLDKIGVMAQSVQEARLLLRIISGYDPKDSTSADIPFNEVPAKPLKGQRIGCFSTLIEQCSPGVRQEILKAKEWFIKQGAIVEDVSLPLVEKAGLATYYLVAMSEASTNLARYCGLRYGAQEPLQGNFNEYFSKVRSMHFGDEAKRRIILGTYARMAGFRDAYYLKALKIRSRIIAQYKDLLRRFDMLLSPTTPIIAPRFEEISQLTPAQHFSIDQCVAPVNLAGLPHISVPCGTSEGMPVGLLFISDHFKEEELCHMAERFMHG